ncbi:AAA domain-containing protein [Ditylenchus destructor]|uniref:AAA domain-containing protein n=1 Tax=Ditylenchus destructor TaxID=166010 RepID=A0AAD4MHG7_9BILA|nr:AAA domain-containing protein [Ditylenchus destructor]
MSTWLRTYSHPKNHYDRSVFLNHNLWEKEVFRCVVSQQRALAKAESSQVGRRVLDILPEHGDECTLVLGNRFGDRPPLTDSEKRLRVQQFRRWFKQFSKANIFCKQKNYSINGLIVSPTAEDISGMETVTFRRIFGESDLTAPLEGLSQKDWMTTLRCCIQSDQVLLSSTEFYSVAEGIEFSDTEDDSSGQNSDVPQITAVRDFRLASIPGYELVDKSDHVWTDEEMRVLLDQGLLEKQKDPVLAAMNPEDSVIPVHAGGGTGKSTLAAKCVYYLHTKGMYPLLGMCAESNHTIVDFTAKLLALDPTLKTQVLLLRSTTNKWHGTDNNPLWDELGLQAHLQRLQPSQISEGEDKLIGKFYDLVDRDETIDIDDTAVISLVVAKLVIPIVAGTRSQWGKNKTIRKQVGMFFVDEASQISQINLRNLLKNTGARVMLLGDDKQLPPFTAFHTGLTPFGLESPLKHIIDRGITKVHVLRENMRSHPEITKFCSKLLYNGQIVPGVTAEDKSHVIRAGKGFPLVTQNYPLLLIHSSCRDQPWEGASRVNWGQQDLALKMATACHTHSHCQVMIITPYLSAKHEMQKFLTENAYSRDQIGVSTIEGFQGEQAAIIIFVTIRTEPDRNPSFVLDQFRLGTAITRPTELLIIIGDCNYLNKPGLSGDIIRELSSNSLIVGEPYVAQVEDHIYNHKTPLYYNGILVLSDLFTTIAPAWVLLSKGKRKIESAEPILSALQDMHLEPSLKRLKN